MVKSYKLVIPTIRGYEQAYDHLRASLRAVNISDDDIVTVYGKEAENKVTGNVVTIQNNLYEYNAVLGAHLYGGGPDTVFILLHDTCEAGPQFKDKLEKLVSSFKSGIVWACPTGQCNICLFSPEVANIAWEALSGMLTIAKMDAIKMEHNTHVLAMKRYRVPHIYLPERQQPRGSRIVYSNVTREVLYFPALDLTKFFVMIRQDSDHPQKP